MNPFAQATFSNMPILMLLIPVGKRVAFTPLRRDFCMIVDYGDPKALISAAGIDIWNEHGYFTYDWDKTYVVDEHPCLKAWLKRQHVQISDFGFMA